MSGPQVWEFIHCNGKIKNTNNLKKDDTLQILGLR